MKTQSSKPQKPKKGEEKPKGKGKEKEKEKQKEKENKKVEELDSDEEYYTEEEIKLLDKFHEITHGHFEDEEIYDIMVKFHNDEELIKNELDDRLKQIKRGDEFTWTEIGKSN